METGSTSNVVNCPLCGKPAPYGNLSEVGWLTLDVKQRMLRDNPEWRLEENACSRCVVDAILHQLIDSSQTAAHGSSQNSRTLDAETEFGPLPTPLRLHSDPRYTGAGVTIAMIDFRLLPTP